MSSIPLDTNVVTAVQAELGSRVSPILINAIEYDLYEKVMEWMETNIIPADIIRAMELCRTLHDYAKDAEAGKLDQLDAADLPTHLIDASNIAIKFGGEFLGWNAGENQVACMQPHGLCCGKN